MTSPAAAPTPPLLSLQGIRKRFGGVVALDGVDFDLQAGEIHALLGENGAGKSTLIRILGGIQPADAGHILLHGAPTRIDDVAHADRLGIRLIHQELSLAPNLTVAENLFLGREPARWGLVRRRQMIADAVTLRDTLHLPEIGEVEARVADLSVAQQQMVEIARALSVKARILVLDEPTASLSATETESLFATLRRLRAQGVGIVYISHRLEEIQRLADRITVLRDGRTVGTQAAATLQTRELIRWMVGRDLAHSGARPPHHPGPLALRVRNLRNPHVHGVSFDLHAGEILGFPGLVGAGRTALARALFGLDPITHGHIEINGHPVTLRSPADALRAGLVLIPEDRKREGLILTQTIAYNLALPWTREWLPGLWPQRARRAAIVDHALRTFAIRTPDPERPVTTLSGGNQQKVVVGRWMERPPRILILDEPTRGVDVGARQEMFDLIHGLLPRGLAVILISSDLPEVMTLAHRLALYRDGHILREVPADAVTAEQVMAELTRN